MCSIYENAEGNKAWILESTYILKEINKLKNTEITAYEFSLTEVIDSAAFVIPTDVEFDHIYYSK